MARIGDTVRPELGRTNYGGYLAGAQQGAAAMGRGIQQAGQAMGDMLKQQGEMKKDIASSEKVASAIAGMYGEESQIGQAAMGISNTLRNEETPFRQKYSAAQAMKQIIPMMMHKSETDTARGFQERGMKVAEGGLLVQQAAATNRAAQIRTAAESKAAEERGKGIGYDILSTMKAGKDNGAGGALLGLDGEPIRYNARDTLLSENFYALADPGHPLWKNLP